ncbi:MAG: hypothetical protein CHACPFDD_03347 [Phycisphaerae bacterium]|nr:hypothetical protein [Phycisphaerae bacterium]
MISELLPASAVTFAVRAPAPLPPEPPIEPA